MKKKNVVVQITSASTGGIGRLTRDICDALPKEQFEPHIAYVRGKLFDAKRDFMFGNKLEVLVHGGMTRLTDKAGLYSKRGTAELIDYLKANDPALVHLHNLHGYYVNYEMLFEYIKENNIPVVWTLHDCWAFTGHCVNFSLQNCMRWKSQCHDCPQTNSYPASKLLDNSSSNFERKKNSFQGVKNMTIVTPSKWLADLAQESILKEYPITVINNGIDLNLFTVKSKLSDVHTKYKLPPKKLILGLASTWSDRKGLSDFIKLNAMIKEEYAIVLVGLSKKQCEGLPHNMIGIEHTENASDLVDLYNVAHIFLNLTYEDNFPTTNLEALACGTSVLTYKTGGSVESITKDTGYIVEQGKLDEVVSVIEQHNKTEQTVECCRSQAQRFDKYSAFGKYSALYQRLIEENA